MFHDAQEELERLEAELLEEEPEESDVPEDVALEQDELDGFPTEEPQTPLVYSNYSNQYGKDLRNYASGYRAYNTDTTDRDLEEYSEAVRQPKKPGGILALSLIALALLAAIAAVLAWWLWRLGILG